MPGPKLTKLYIGIDIGNSGAIAVMGSRGEFFTTTMPLIGKYLDIHATYLLLDKYRSSNCHVVFEDLSPIFNISAKANGSLMRSAGAIEALVVALELPYTKVQAKVWQKEMFQGVREMTKPSSTKKTMVRDTKSMALMACKRLFPKVSLLATERSKVPHNGIVDAILMAEFCKRKY